MTEKEKMLKGLIYNPFDKELIKLRVKAHSLCKKYNALDEDKINVRGNILNQLFPNKGKNICLTGPIYIDYGVFTTFGDNCFAGFNLTILDSCPVTIGKNVLFGPNVSLFTPLHPLCYEDRNIHPNIIKNKLISLKVYGAPITIEDNCWIAGNVTICGGVKIGSGSVIGAGSVVTKNIPSNSLAFGNPCKVIRKISKKDSLRNHPELIV